MSLATRTAKKTDLVLAEKLQDRIPILARSLQAELVSKVNEAAGRGQLETCLYLDNGDAGINLALAASLKRFCKSPGIGYDFRRLRYCNGDIRIRVSWENASDVVQGIADLLKEGLDEE